MFVSSAVMSEVHKNKETFSCSQFGSLFEKDLDLGSFINEVKDIMYQSKKTIKSTRFKVMTDWLLVLEMSLNFISS